MGVAGLSLKQYLLNVAMFPLRLAALFVSVYLLREEGRSLEAVVYVLPNIALIFGEIGLRGSTIYFISKKKADAREVGSTALWAGLFFGALWAGIIGSIYYLHPGIIRLDIPWEMRLAVLAQMPFSMANQLMVTFHIHRRFLVRNGLLKLGNKAVRVTTIALVVYLIAPGEPMPSVMYAIILIHLGLTVGLTLSHLIILRDWVLGLPSIRLLGRMLKFGWPHTIAASAMYVLHYGDTYYLDRLAVDRNMVGIYSVAYMVLMVVAEVGQSVTQIFVRRSLDVSDQESDRLIASIARRTGILMCAIAGAVALGTPVLVEVLPSGFSAAGPVLLILLLSVIPYAMSEIVSMSAFSRGRIFINSLSPLAAMLLNVGLNILWIPEYGMFGAAWATVLSFSLLFAGRYFIYWRIVGTSAAMEVFRVSGRDIVFFVEKIRQLRNWLSDRGKG